MPDILQALDLKLQPPTSKRGHSYPPVADPFLPSQIPPPLDLNDI